MPWISKFDLQVLRDAAERVPDLELRLGQAAELARHRGETIKGLQEPAGPPEGRFVFELIPPYGHEAHVAERSKWKWIVLEGERLYPYVPVGDVAFGIWDGHVEVDSGLAPTRQRAEEKAREAIAAREKIERITP